MGTDVAAVAAPATDMHAPCTVPNTRLHACTCAQVVGGLALMGLRIAQALLLRVFLTWLRAATASSQAAPAASQSSASASPSHNAGWLGWLLALGLGLLTFVICTVQHQWSFAGNELGLKAQQVRRLPAGSSVEGHLGHRRPA